MNNTINIKWVDYLLMFLLICISGNPVMPYLFGSYVYIIMFFFVIVFYGKHIKKTAIGKAFLWIILFLIIFIGQYVTLKTISYQACINYVCKVLIGLTAAFVFGKKFPVVYLKTIFVLTIIALIFWLLNSVGIYPSAPIHFSNPLDSFIVYSQPRSGYNNTLGFVRNSGMFWEPGAYAGYILLAFFFYINRLDYLWINNKIEVVVLLIGLISTFSTTGYIVLGILVFFFLFDRVKNKFLLITLSAIMVFVAITLFNSLEFMGDKIEEEYEAAVNMGEYDYKSSRFGALVMDSYYIKMHPFFGNGLMNKTRFSRHMDIVLGGNIGVGNGFTGEIAYFGIPFMLIYMVSIYRNCSLHKKWRLLILVILLLQGEYYMNYPMFFVLPFVIFYNSDNDLQEIPIAISQNE